MTGQDRKKIGIQLPSQAQNQTTSERYALELEALAPVGDIIDIRADTPAEFAAGVKDVDAIITSWGLRIDRQVIDALEKCVVIGVGSVGVDMVDIEAATEAGIVVTNVPDVFGCLRFRVSWGRPLGFSPSATWPAARPAGRRPSACT